MGPKRLCTKNGLTRFSQLQIRFPPRWSLWSGVGGGGPWGRDPPPVLLWCMAILIRPSHYPPSCVLVPLCLGFRCFTSKWTTRCLLEGVPFITSISPNVLNPPPKHIIPAQGPGAGKVLSSDASLQSSCCHHLNQRPGGLDALPMARARSQSANTTVTQGHRACAWT